MATGGTYDRYEADPATEYLDVELARDSDMAGYVITNKLDVVRPGETAAWRTTNIVWAVSETAKTVRVSLARAEGEAFREGEISLRLRDRNNHVKATTPVVCRSFFENSNNNPLWLGEKNTDELGWGEWTMDLDVATGKVAMAEGESFTLVCVQGSRWCPDCANTDANFLGLTDEKGDNRFRRWAESNHVALAVVDIPNYGERDGTDPETCRSPSMFSRTAYAANGALRSGRYYLSRKMISDDDARTMRARCHFLASSNTDKGGFHRPEDPNPYRTGVPTFVLLRKDGSVAARLVRFSVVSPGAADRANWGNFIARFDEMLKSASDSGEIANNHWSTTSLLNR